MSNYMTACPSSKLFDANSKQPAFVQLYSALRKIIIEGRLRTNDRLPPTRSYAVELGVSRTTVVSAYAQLTTEGYIEGRAGAGYFVCSLGEVENQLNESPQKPHLRASIAWPELKEHLQTGSADMRLFPHRQWAKCFSRIARLAPEALITNADPFGDRILRESIADYLRDWRGFNTPPQQIIITAGSGDAMELCIRTLVSPTDTIALENPGYTPLRNFVSNLGLHLSWLTVNEKGTHLPATDMKKTPKLVVITPSHQYPLGGTMSPARRSEFTAWADKNDAWIIEDDYDSEFRYAGRPITAMAEHDPSARTIYVGSLAKIFSGGLRLGFLVAPRPLLNQFKNTLEQVGSKAASSAQRPLAEFMQNGEFYRHLRRVRRHYTERRKVLITLLETELGANLPNGYISFKDHQAGMHIAALFNQRRSNKWDDQVIARNAQSQGATVTALSLNFASEPVTPGLILGFCAFTPDEIQFNIKIIRLAIEHQLHRE